MKLDWLMNAVMGVLVVCALTVTGLLVKQEFLSGPGSASAQAPRVVDDWKRVASRGQRLGPAGARVVLVEFSDFQCPYCKSVQPVLARMRSRYPRDVAVVYRHYPLESIHPYARQAAVAAECAGLQGRFEPFHDVLYGHQGEIGKTSWAEFARAAGVGRVAEFEQCVAGERTLSRVQEDVKAGDRAGVTGTPTLLVNETVVVNPSEDVLDGLIRDALRRMDEGDGR